MQTTLQSYRRGQVLLHLDAFPHIIEHILCETDDEIVFVSLGSDTTHRLDKRHIRPATDDESISAYAVYSFSAHGRDYKELYAGDIIRIFGQEYIYQREMSRGRIVAKDPVTGKERIFKPETHLFLPYK